MILVIANYRTGSTTLCKQLCEQYGYTMSEKSGELFHGRNTKPYSSEYDNYVVKLMPDHFSHCQQHFTEFYHAAERVIYCVRRDYGAQYISYHSCIKTQQWHPQHIEPSQHIRDNLGVDFRYEFRMHYHKTLLNNLEAQSKLYKKYPGELCYLEDRPWDGYRPRVHTNPPSDSRMFIDVESYFE